MTDSVDFSVGEDEASGDMVPRSLADRIKSQLAARKRKVFTFMHPDCPEWTVSYRLPVNRSEVVPFYERAEKAAKRKQRYSVDAAVLAAFNVGLRNMGEDLVNDAGSPLTVRDRAVMDLLDGATSPSEAIRTLYGSDGIVSAVAEKLMGEAGYGTGDDVVVNDAEDPTNAG